MSIFALPWSPLPQALAAMLLVVQLVGGRANPARTARYLAWTALVALLAQIPTLAIQLQDAGTLRSQGAGDAVATAVDLFASSAATLLSYGAWTVLLYEAVRAGDRVRLGAFALTFVLAQALQIALGGGISLPIPAVAGFIHWMQQLPPWGGAAVLTLTQVSVVAVAVCAVFAAPPAVQADTLPA